MGCACKVMAAEKGAFEQSSNTLIKQWGGGGGGDL